MDCYTSGLIGIGMLMATFSTLTVSEDQHDVLRKVLSPELDIIHERIVNERRNIYLQGLIIGLIIALIVLKRVKTVNKFHRISLGLGITILFSVIYYFVIPKSDYMLNHLKTQEENRAWLEVYNTMKHRYLFGFIFGSLASIPIVNFMC